MIKNYIFYKFIRYNRNFEHDKYFTTVENNTHLYLKLLFIINYRRLNLKFKGLLQNQ